MKEIYCAKKLCRNKANYIVADIYNSLDRQLSIEQLYCLKHAQEIFEATIDAHEDGFEVSLYLIKLISTTKQEED